MSKHILRKCILSLSLILYLAYHLGAFFLPSLNIQFTAPKKQIEQTAIQILKQYNLYNTEDKMASMVTRDLTMQSYLEELSGQEEAKKQIQSQNIPFVYWAVRFYQPLKITESYVYLSTQGKLLGFNQSIPNLEARPTLSQKEAKKLAIKHLKSHLPKGKKITFLDYSSIKHQNRIDHHFKFKDPELKLPRGGFKTYEVTISGQSIIGLNLGLSSEIPQSFITEYGNSRSANNNLAIVSSLGIVMLLIIFGLSSAIYLVRSYQLSFIQPLTFAGMFSIFTFIYSANTWPASWFYYKTSESLMFFKLSLLGSSLRSSLLYGLLTFILMMVTEGIYRATNPKKPLLLSTFNKDILLSSYIKKAFTLGWFLTIGMMLYECAYYFITTKYFNFRIPLSTITDPNILSLPLPWIQPFYTAFSAAVFEESVFRILPLAATSLWVEKYKRSNNWTYMVVLISAIIWAGAHADYPVSPFYSRLIELSLIGTVFGLIYLNKGPISLIIAHFVYDLVLMSTPVFMSEITDLILSKLILISLILSPFLLIIFSPGRSLPQTLLNKSFKYAPFSSTNLSKSENSTPKIRTSVIISLILIALLPFYLRPTVMDFNISEKTQVMQLAQKKLSNLNLDLNNNDWDDHVLLKPNVASHDWAYVRDQILKKNEDFKSSTTEIIKALNSPYWTVRYQKPFNTQDLIKRQEKISMQFNIQGDFIEYIHVLPDNITPQTHY